MKFVVAAVGVMILASTPVTGDVASAASAATPLVGTNWVLSGMGNPRVRLGGVTVSARFGTDNQMTGENACNSYGTGYTVKGSRVSIGTEIVSTQVACSATETRVARAYSSRLPKVRFFAVRGTTLTLSDANKRSLLTYQASGAEALIGSWTATSYYTGSAVQSVIIGSTLTADFAAKDVSGNSGCNTFSGPYTTDGDTIAIGPLASTLRACTDPALNTQEQQYLAALALAKTYRVTGNRLELLRDGDTIAVTFEKTK